MPSLHAPISTNQQQRLFWTVCCVGCFLRKNIRPENQTQILYVAYFPPRGMTRSTTYVLNVLLMCVLTKASSWAVIKGGGPGLIGEACGVQEIPPPPPPPTPPPTPRGPGGGLKEPWFKPNRWGVLRGQENFDWQISEPGSYRICSTDDDVTSVAATGGDVYQAEPEQ